MKILKYILLLIPLISFGQIAEPYRASSKVFLDSPAVIQRFTTEDVDEPLLEATIFHWVNRIRRQHRLSRLAFHPRLNRIARAHSTEMAKFNYFSHESPIKTHKTLMMRFRKSKTHWRGQIAENIAVSFTKSWVRTGYFPSELDDYPYDTYYKFAKHILDKWMRSSGHRKNILNPKLKLQAIGVARGQFNGLDAIYVTQNFATRILN